jgi:hypothetical protein
MDKIKLKEDVGLVMKTNPFVSKLSRLCRILANNSINSAFLEIQEATQMQI